MATLTRRQRFPFPDLPDWFDAVPARFAVPEVRIEDYVEEDHYVMRAELPGMGPEDIDVVVGDGVLTVRAERTEKERDKNHDEIRYGAMTRSVTLPANADEDDVEADYTKGMLTVRVGLATAKSEARHVEIRHEN
ncbi:Hsp20/alpha crystallin family protein [Streptomyces sp. NPDC048566]|uniref:Hsp20/alpha crystallin family protein n=1 Tax=Streptomyces sp. NPDC048566 TaxID=3365569 RepID=UPI00371EECA2